MEIQICGLLLNFIIYLIMILPSLFIGFINNFSSKKNFALLLFKITILEIIFSIFIYKFSRNIFSLFSTTKGIINYAVYASKILFISSSLYGFKILIPAYFIKNKITKKETIFVLSKIVSHVLLGFLGFIIFNTKGILFSIPLCDLIYSIIYIILFINR